MHFDDDFTEYWGESILLPPSVLCLEVPGTSGEELVVHREGGDDFVFLFEALDDALKYAQIAQQALGFVPDIGRVSVAELEFKNARFKPAVGQHVDIPLEG